jgi:hypothetical protein
VVTEVNIIPFGGLRIGAQWSWLEGAPPRFLVEGVDGQAVTVNDAPVNLDEEGCITSPGHFASAGEFTIKAGATERKVRIVKPRVRPDATEILPAENAAKAQHSVILEAGHWNLIGSFPGEIETIEASGLGSSLVFCDFEPVWAIKLGARKSGTRVIELVKKPVEISVMELLKTHAKAIRRIKRTTAAQRWASAIRAADSRNSDAESSDGDKGGVEKNWGKYVQIARVIKRLTKKGLL